MNEVDEQDECKVEGLANFPFEHFATFKEAVSSGAAHIAADRAFALRWMQYRIGTSKSEQIKNTLLTWLPWVAVVGYIIWVIFNDKWTMLLAIPILLIGNVIFHPGFATVLGWLRNLALALTFIGLVYAYVANRAGLLALCTALAIIWLGIRTAYSNSVKNVIRAALLREDLLCALWKDKTLSVFLNNGTQYWANFKVENGKMENYD